MSGCHVPLKEKENENDECKCVYCLSKRITNLEQTNKELIDKIAEIGNFYYRDKKQPYKCPVCLGAGVTNCLTNPLIKYDEKNVECVPCKGKGIVWG